MIVVYSFPMQILGIDPGTGRVGWAVLDKEKGRESLVECGCLETKANTPLPQRLAFIFEEVGKLIKQFGVEQVAIEELFFTRNVKTAMSVGQARGVVLLACQLQNVPSFSYTPSQVKMAVTGYGKADKKQVQEMVKRILRLEKIPKPDDAADAAAVALCHSATGKLLRF